MNVTIFQHFKNIEPYFWTKEEIDNIKDTFFLYEDRYFTINDVNYKWKYINEERFMNFNIQLENGINIVVMHGRFASWEILPFIKKIQSENDKIVYIVLTKLVEDYWGSAEFKNEELLKELGEINNVRIVWDVPFYKLNNFIFSPKVQIQSYFLIGNSVDVDTYYFGRDVFLKYPKEYRIGFHINKLSSKLRYNVARGLQNYKNKNLFYTVNSDCTINTKRNDLNELSNFQTKLYDSYLQYKTDGSGTSSNWYMRQFLEMGIKSEMEIVYETSTYTDDEKINELWLVKWNEKTIKHLYLGKPFIHCDPIAHKLMYENEMIPYRSLYTNELWDIYDNWDINRKNDFTFVDELIKNIKWLSEMDESEWSERIGEANRIAELNKNKIDHLIFNTSLMDIVKSDIY
jgi:hypothetical protein